MVEKTLRSAILLIGRLETIHLVNKNIHLVRLAGILRLMLQSIIGLSQIKILLVRGQMNKSYRLLQRGLCKMDPAIYFTIDLIASNLIQVAHDLAFKLMIEIFIERNE